MEQSPYQRLELFWQSKGLKSPAAFADSVQGLSSSALSAMKKRRSTPSASVMRCIQLAYPDVNPDFILWGTGGLLKDDRALTPMAAAPATPTAPLAAEEPAAPYTPPPAISDTVGKLLDELNRQAARYQGEIQQQHDRYEKLLTDTSRHWQYTVDRMDDQLKEKRVEIKELKEEIHHLKGVAGLRPLTHAEAEARAKETQPQRRTAVKGLRSYEEDVPQAAEVEMVLTRGESDFSRPRVAEPVMWVCPRPVLQEAA